MIRCQQLVIIKYYKYCNTAFINIVPIYTNKRTVLGFKMNLTQKMDNRLFGISKEKSTRQFYWRYHLVDLLKYCVNKKHLKYFFHLICPRKLFLTENKNESSRKLLFCKMKNLEYEIFLWIFEILVDLFSLML